MQKTFLRLIVTLIVLLLASNAVAQQQLIIAGTGDSQQLLRQLAQAFEAANPGSKIIVPDSIGSSGGVKALVKGKTDLARIARPLKDKEKAMADDLNYRVFAYSPVVFTANLPDKCLDNLTSAQVADIFSGKVTDWAEFGSCPSQKIYVAMRESGDSSRSVLEKKIPEFKAISQFAGKTIYSTPETVQTLTEHLFTIGYLPQASVTKKLQTFAFNGVAPSATNILNMSYPLTSPFGLVWRGQLSPLASKFMAFINSVDGAKIVREIGVVPASGSK